MNHQATSIEVILDIFSGRPNPHWTLSDEQINQLQERIGRLDARREASPAKAPGLGYRGFIITNASNDPRIPNRIEVYASVLSIGEHGRTRSYEDASGVERWLFEQARSLGYGDIID
jgi:hypothetical protein